MAARASRSSTVSTPSATTTSSISLNSAVMDCTRRRFTEDESRSRMSDMSNFTTSGWIWVRLVSPA
jgi:hypothetical protein